MSEKKAEKHRVTSDKVDQDEDSEEEAAKNAGKRIARSGKVFDLDEENDIILEGGSSSGSEGKDDKSESEAQNQEDKVEQKTRQQIQKSYEE